MQYQGILPSVITDLRAKARLNISEAAEICGVQAKCFERWEITGKIPTVAYELLKARAGAIWDGWTWHNGVLTDYAGRTYREHDLMAAFYTLAAAEARNIEFIHAKAGNLKHENNEKLKRAPVPCSVSVPDFESKRQQSFKI